MLRTLGDQVSLWESLLPEEVLRLPAELARVDRLLDDAVCFAPFVSFFSLTAGRPSTPMDCYLRPRRASVIADHIIERRRMRSRDSVAHARGISQRQALLYRPRRLSRSRRAASSEPCFRKSRLRTRSRRVSRHRDAPGSPSSA